MCVVYVYVFVYKGFMDDTQDLIVWPQFIFMTHLTDGKRWTASTEAEAFITVFPSGVRIQVFRR